MEIRTNGKVVNIGENISIPPGGLAGQVLMKSSDADGAFVWGNLDDIGASVVPDPDPELSISVIASKSVRQRLNN